MSEGLEANLRRRGMMFVLSSPSGAGKTTLSRRLLEQHPGIGLSISVTTRPQRSSEIHGRDYFFVSAEEFESMLRQKAFLEHATVFEHRYGTPAKYVEEMLVQGTDVLFDIDWQGTRQLAARSRRDLVSVFILPPSLAELERRLKTRAQDSEAVVKARMEKAQDEISHWEEYDYVVINHNLEDTLAHIISIIEAERLKRTRQIGLADFVAGLK